MSAVKQASGGDGWSTWTATRQGDDWTIIVTSKAESERAPTPSGWQPKVLHEETLRDNVGRRAVDRGISLSATYAARMAN